MMDEIKQAELVEQIVRRVRQWGIDGLVSVLLDGLRPFSFIGGQLLWLVQPAASLLVDRQRVADLANLMEKPEALELLRSRLEEC